MEMSFVYSNIHLSAHLMRYTPIPLMSRDLQSQHLKEPSQICFPNLDNPRLKGINLHSQSSNFPFRNPSKSQPKPIPFLSTPNPSFIFSFLGCYTHDEVDSPRCDEGCDD